MSGDLSKANLYQATLSKLAGGAERDIRIVESV
jgi:hypothetical protein